MWLAQKRVISPQSSRVMQSNRYFTVQSRLQIHPISANRVSLTLDIKRGTALCELRYFNEAAQEWAAEGGATSDQRQHENSSLFFASCNQSSSQNIWASKSLWSLFKRIFQNVPGQLLEEFRNCSLCACISQQGLTTSHMVTRDDAILKIYDFFLI